MRLRCDQEKVLRHVMSALISHALPHVCLTSNSILSGVVLAASLIPRHSRKKNAVAYRNSMRARCMPMQDRAPAPKGWNASFAAGDCASATVSLSPIHRCGLKLFSVSFLSCDKRGVCNLRQRVVPDLWIAVECVCLRIDRYALRDVVPGEFGTTLRHHSRQAAWRSTVES